MAGMKKKLMELVLSNSVSRSLARDSVNAAKRLRYQRRTRGIQTDRHTILFCTFSGKGCSDSPRAIYEYMRNREEYRDYRYIWAFQNPEQFPEVASHPRTSLVRYGSADFEREMARAGYWILNFRVSDHIWPKQDQVYLECWHGTPLKRLGYDLHDSDNVMNSAREIHQKYDLDAAKFRYILSPSPFTSKVFTSAWNLKHHGKEKAVLEAGYPRNDRLCTCTPEEQAAVRTRLHLTPAEIGTKKVLLYAPTWRDNQHDAALGYTYELGVDFDRLRQALGQDYVILFRAHYLVASRFDFGRYGDFVRNVSDYPDINDLFIASDLLVTDYSSVFFDYANLERPMVFYMYDLADYRDDIRGFYFDLSELPGPIVETEDALIEAVRAQSGEFVPDERYRAFRRKFNPLDDGNASRRVVETLLGDG